MNVFKAVLICLFAQATFAATTHIESPDHHVTVDFSLQADGSPAYQVTYLGKPVVLESRLGLSPDFVSGFEVVGTSTDTHESEWLNAFGERKMVPDNYDELNVDLKTKSSKLLRITFRAYNEGAAFRYSIPNQQAKTFTFNGERSEFHFPDGTFGYEEHGTEGEYHRNPITEFQPWCERPLTIEYASGLFASLMEADNERYPRMLLSPSPDIHGALVSALGGSSSNLPGNQRNDGHATLAAGDSTPWRVLIVGQSPGDLLERNYLLLNLNPPLALKDTSWIKPGKAMRDTTLTTDNAKAVIDFAATGGLQYVGFDWKWYGTEDPATGDATTVRVRNLDLPTVISYGQQKNVGVILYVDRRQIKSQRDTLFALYEKWGVKGVKIGFVDVGPQEETAWITETIQHAADHHLLLDIHDGYRATGNSRTYPNLLTVEGIRGNEHMPTPEHNTTLPFTRYISGAGDYTVCYMTNRKKTTYAHQLAMAVVAFSPMQWMYWYDKPADYHNEPELEFIRHVPTVWDDTKVIDGKIGEHAIIARRSGDDWFIGAINNSESRQLRLPLAFLAADRQYIANIYFDDDSITTHTKVGIERRTVTSQTTLDLTLKPAGGEAIWITPSKQ